ncbi:acetylserotonin O-methyltransferase isoform X1 [Trichosurus vulpecula]|uniref:acetylserotonin O-methyltransferase isoform X1 n=1 Tax=Trichosurus vulpecula TaxID=9337 RepID=UPI00186AD03D|nr:acetylserotonin O-methyltransferase isoform X1 [Trichosurus vulpecula]
MSLAEDLDYGLFNEYINGFMVSKAMFTACELGVFDLLESEKFLTFDVIAERLGTNSQGMEQLLDICVTLKLLKVEMKREKALYQNTELATLYLTKSGPKSQYNMLLYMSKTTYSCWNHLTEAIREGKNQYMRTFGIPSDDLFEAIYRSEEELVKFMHGLHEIWSINGRDVLTAFDLSPFPLIYDLGGCSGALAKECITIYPESQVTIFEKEEVVHVARKHFPFLEEPRISFHIGDFFRDPIPEADLYILARILHDWADDKCILLLTNIHQACKPGSGVLVVETLLDEDKRGPLTSQLYSMNMLVQAEGKERNPTEYRKIFTQAGFQDFQFKKTGKIYDAILARK